MPATTLSAHHLPALPHFDSRGLAIPLFPWMVNHGLDRFARVADAIDTLERTDLEWSIVPVLVSEPSYLHFLTQLLGIDTAAAVGFLNDFRDDAAFAAEMSAALDDLDTLSAAGDLRFHAITMYVAVRALRPTWMIETGVAHGKSSAFALLAMAHNGHGRLVSIDLAPDGHLDDGSLTAMEGRIVGWLVPDRLRDRWELIDGDSLAELPRTLAAMLPAGPDVFLHDSLHTLEHTAGEIGLVLDAASGPVMVLVDNIDMGSGYALAEMLQERRVVGHAYRDFGGALIPAPD